MRSGNTWQERVRAQIHDLVVRLLEEVDDPTVCDEPAPERMRLEALRLALRVEPGS
jgi:hypothetical protein